MFEKNVIYLNLKKSNYNLLHKIHEKSFILEQ